MDNMLLCLLIGLSGGVASGLVGIGGGVVIIPLLIFFLKFSQHLAQGTTLAMMLPPIGILAALTYYRQGYVDVKVAVCLCAGFVLGGWLGARAATLMSGAALEKVFGVFLLGTSIKMIFFK